MATTQMIQKDNVSGIVLYGRKLPNGRTALAEEELQIRNWIRTIQHMEQSQYVKLHSTGESRNRIVIEVNHGTQPIVISTYGDDHIEIVDNAGESRFGKQDELRKFIESI